MTEILCRWLNEELGLSRRVEPRTFAKEFSTGYLIGEILNKHQLQEDFDQFSQGRNAVSQLNNFQRLLPTLQLLGVMFSDNVVKALIEEQHGAATRLLYQIYIALRRKEKAQLSKMTMETMRPPAAAKLASISAEMYKERMKSMIPREVDMALRRVSDRYIAKGKEVEEEAALKDEQELQKQQSIQEEQQTQHLEMLHKAKKQNKELMEKVQGSIIPVSKKMPREMENTSLKRKQELRKKEAEMFNNEITKFEKILKNLTPAGGEEESGSSLNLPGRAGPRHLLSSPCTRVEEGQSFIENVRTRLKEDRRARREREKRRRRVMLELLEAHEAQEEVYQEEELVNRLMRQSLQERRVTVQLVHARHEKHVMEQNRFFREKQYEEQRLKEFRQALDREEILARQERVEQGERMEQEREVHEQLMVERAERRYRKHYHLCQEVVTHILDLVTKVAEYRELCVGLIPNKLMREWKELFFTQMPIYEQPDAQLEASGERAVDSIEQAKMHLLNSQDYEDYQLMTGEWQPPVDGDIHGPPPDNNVLGHVVNRITEIAHPAKEPSPPPQFPPFPIKACILGKLHAGKTTCLKHLAEALNIQAISPETLVQEAVQAFSAGETADPGVSQEHGTDTQTVAGSPDPAQQQAEDSGVPHGHNGEKGVVQDLLHDPSMDHFEPPTPGSGADQQPAPETQEEWKEVPEAQTRTSAKQESQPSARAQLGERAVKFLRKGKSVPDDLLTEMVNECLRRLPAGCGWILDGFPATITQAKLLEKLLTGVDPDYTVPKTRRSRTKIAVDPKASKEPLPPRPALDIAILLEVSDNTVLVRHLHDNVGQCAEAMIQKTSGEQGPQEILDVGGNMSPTEEQLLPRLTSFLEHWPKLEKWFTGQQILAKVNGELQQAELLEKLELVLVESLLKKHSRDAVTEKPPEETTPALAETSPSQGHQQTFPKDVNLVGSGSVSVPSSAKEKIKVSLGDKKQNKSASISQADTMSKQSSAKGKSGKLHLSPGNGKKSKSGSLSQSGSAKGKKGKEQKAKVELYPSEITGETDDALPPAPKPGSDQWVYVDEPVPQEIVEYLCHYWDSIVETYTSTIHRVMQELRREQQRAIQDLHTLRTALMSTGKSSMIRISPSSGKESRVSSGSASRILSPRNRSVSIQTRNPGSTVPCEQHLPHETELTLLVISRSSRNAATIRTNSSRQQNVNTGTRPRHNFPPTHAAYGKVSTPSQTSKRNAVEFLTSLPLSQMNVEDVQQHLCKLKEAGIITEFRNPYASPVVVAQKKNGKVRMHVDFRTLNRRTVPDQHAVPRIENGNDFWEYMESRPDHKQAFVSQWQDDYNSIPEDQRGDDDVKAELMLRLYTLRECLWDISDKRKEEAEQERQNAMENGWLQDHLGILLNLYSTLMQVEVDRFQDTSRFLQDYYKGMEGKIPLDSSKEFARIPLVNVADVELPALGGPDIVSVTISSPSNGQRKPNSPGSSSNALKDGELVGGQELKQFSTPDSDGRGKPETGSPGSRGKAEQEGEWEGVQEMKEFRVPLVPYRIPSSNVIVKEKSKLPVKVTGKAKEEVVVTDAPSFTDIDEYLISEAYHTAVSALSNIIQREVKLKEDEEKKEQKLKQDKEKDQPKSSAGKDGKKKSAEKKKGQCLEAWSYAVPEPGNGAGAGEVWSWPSFTRLCVSAGLRSTTPVLSALVENPQEVSRREHIYTEYFGALQDEAAAVTTHLALIKLKALMTIQDLKSKAGDLFTTMEDWLGIQFLQEMNSIAALLAVGLQHVQTGTKILFPLVLGSQEFFINGDLKLIPDPPPPPHLPPKERPKVGEFTVQQLQDLVQHFSLLSPTGFMTRRGFIETLQDLISQDLGSDNLPEPWCSLTYPQLVEISRVLAPDSDFLDWRQFVLSIAQPWPYPSLRDLLDTKIRFQAVDQADSGYVTKEQYDQVELWFTGHADQQDPEDPLEPIPFNRLAQLKEVFFGLFVEDGPSEPRLDYNNTLLYFSRHQDPAQGLHRALSITVGSALPWAPLSSPQKSEQYVPQHVPGGPPAPGPVEKVPLSALFQIMTHGVAGIGETHRQWSLEAGRHRQCQLFTQVYKELGSKELEPVPFDVLLKHPVIMDLITKTTRFSQSDVHAVIQRQFLDGEAVASSSPEPSSSPADEPGQAQSRLKMSRL
ncbi:sperm flagellar protein 2 [Mobula hypostoma]|uniref:sperm flagellar protein 2 n=1 Tax=Mobula hypostoma TaxID=723540 RepID=UPI002FC2D554